MILVFHNDQFLRYTFDKSSLRGAVVHLAASVQTDELEEAFRFTNNIDEVWVKNEGVNPTGHSRRSTSVGDILEKDSKIYVVEDLGFRELTKEEANGIVFHKPDLMTDA